MEPGRWLFQFLLHPQPIRSYTILRMPRFNMSEAEARDLVDYFGGGLAAKTRAGKPARNVGDIPQREASHWDKQNKRLYETTKG